MAALRSAERDPDGDPGQPCPERTITSPAGEAPERGHEGLLGRVFCLVEIPEDAVAGPDDRPGFMIDEESERVPIAGQDGLDSGAFIDDPGPDGWRWER